MSQPSIELTELQNEMGVLPMSEGGLLAVLGPANAGPVNQPAAFGRVKQLVDTFGGGELVEAAAREIEVHGRPVIVVRTASSVAGAVGAVDASEKSGSSVVSASGTPTGSFELAFFVDVGGTVGTAGIRYRWSLDNGRTWSAVHQLGTATSFTFPGSGVSFNFSAGSLVAGDIMRVQLSSPRWNTSELGAGLDALDVTVQPWRLVEIVGPIDGDAFDLIEQKFAGYTARGKERAWVGNTRVPNAGESPSAYKTALDTIFNNRATTHGELCAGDALLISSVSGRRYRRPVSYIVGALEAAVSEEVNIADVNLGALRGVSLHDSNGNPICHDESVYPGLDDSRFTVLRTWEEVQGIYVNRPRLFSAAGSDFRLMPHRRVMNIGKMALRAYFTRRLNAPILVDKNTGFILPEEADEIDAGALAALESVLLGKPKASGCFFAISRSDNLLSTFTMTGDMRILPLAYPEFINLTVGFMNPALQVQGV